MKRDIASDTTSAEGNLAKIRSQKCEDEVASKEISK